MQQGTVNIDEMLESILRGAALLLGCNSANFLMYNEARQEVVIRVGIIAEQQQIISDIEELFKSSLMGKAFSIKDIRGSGTIDAITTRSVWETSSLQALVGNVFPADAVKMVADMIGDHRFIHVPVLSGPKMYGYIIFEKAGLTPFSAQQREIMLRYAQRIADLLDNDIKTLGGALTPMDTEFSRRHLLIDKGGEILGRGLSGPADLPDIPPAMLDKIITTAIDMLGQNITSPSSMLWPSGDSAEAVTDEYRREIRLTPFDSAGQRMILADVESTRAAAGAGVKRQLLHMALGETAPTLLVDPEFNITSCNDATGRLCGFGSVELVGKHIGELFRSPEDITSILDHRFLLMSDGYHEEDIIMRHRDGRVFPGNIRALLLADGAQNMVGYMVMIRAQKPEPGGIDTVMRQERLATMGELAAQLSHEIRNPLLAIGATLESLQNGLENCPEEKAIVTMLGDEVVRLDMILRDYMSLAQRYNTSVQPVSLRRVLDSAISLIDASRRGSGESIAVQVPDNLQVMGDFEGLKQVVFNLLINALEATANAGPVQCSAGADTNFVTLNIMDKGPGLPETPRQCFDAFYTTKPNGTGLGLTVVRKIVEAHGGAVSLGNREGGGCCVTVTLPKKES